MRTFGVRSIDQHLIEESGRRPGAAMRSVRVRLRKSELRLAWVARELRMERTSSAPGSSRPGSRRPVGWKFACLMMLLDAFEAGRERLEILGGTDFGERVETRLDVGQSAAARSPARRSLRRI